MWFIEPTIHYFDLKYKKKQLEQDFFEQIIQKSLIYLYGNLRIEYNLQNNPKILNIILSSSTLHQRERKEQHNKIIRSLIRLYTNLRKRYKPQAIQTSLKYLF
jgi:hypothetical protein